MGGRESCLLEQSLFSILPVAELQGGPSPVACVRAAHQLLFGKPHTLQPRICSDTVFCGTKPSSCIPSAPRFSSAGHTHPGSSGSG